MLPTDTRHRATLLGLVWATGFFVVLAATVGLLHFHVDEIITFEVAQQSLSDIASNRLQATHSPVYFWMVKPIAALDGPPYLLRLPSVLFCAIGLGAMVRTLSLHFDPQTANVLGFGLATSPAWLYLAHYARPYALLAMLFAFCICSMVAIFHARLQDPDSGARPVHTGRMPWIWLILSASAANSLMMAGVLHSVALTVTPFFSSRLRSDKRFVRNWLLAMVPVLVSAAAMTLVLSTSIVKRVDTYWADRSYAFSLESITQVFERVFVSTVLPGGIQTIILVCAIILLAGTAFVRLRYRVLIWASLPLAVGLPALLFLASLKTSLLIPRYFYLVAPAWYALAAIGARELWRDKRAAIALLVLLSFLIMQVWRIMDHDTRNTTWTRFAEFVVQSPSLPDDIVPARNARVRTLRFLFEYVYHLQHPIRIHDRPGQDDDLAALVGELTARDKHVWLVGGFTQAQVDAILETDGRLRACSTNAGRVEILIFYRTGKDAGLSGMDCRQVGSTQS